MSAQKDLTIAKEYCTGCGLCAVQGKKLQMDAAGFMQPDLNAADMEFCKSVCPAFTGKHLDDTAPWGHAEKVCLGWSADADVRHHASSGGVTTMLAIYLLESGAVDGVIQVRADSEYAHRTNVVCSTTREEILSCYGSRYSQSHPLAYLREYIQPGKKYAFVGKPCDVYSLRRYLELHPDLAAQIPYLLSFFCAGAPSEKANQHLVKELLGDEKCTSLTYRGNGWPGEASAVSESGKTAVMSYERSWGQILGRDVRKICRFCMDGMGLAADVACCDAWYLTEQNTPDFTEHEGRNGIFARTEKGRELVEKAAAAGYLTVEEFADYEQKLPRMQKYQYTRRTTMDCRMTAMKLMNQCAPAYDSASLRRLGQNGKLKDKLRYFAGTVKRIMKGKI